jgi:regulator of RNase E activity RraA
MKSETRDKLMGVSVATLCSALYKRGLRNQTIQDVRPIRSKGRNMVGPAFTLRYMPAREDRNPMSVFRDPKHPQRVAIETCPEGAVLVMDSRKDPRAASAGDILITRLMVRGGAGVVTDGGFRRTSPCTRQSTSTCRSAAAMSRSSPATWSSVTMTASSSSRQTLPTRLPTKPSK